MSEIIPFKNNDIINTLPDTTLQEIVSMVFWDLQSDVDIATNFDMSKPTLYKLKRTSRFQTALKDFGEIAVREANTKIQAASGKAVTTLIGLLDSDNPGVRLKASVETLRLAGLGDKLPEFTPNQDGASDKHRLATYLQQIAEGTGKGVEN